MAKIMWKSQVEVDEEEKQREKFKGKTFKNLSRKEKDELLEKIALQLWFL